MKCPVCGKHVAEERYELHVGRHTDVAPEAAAETEAAPEAESAGAVTGPETVRSKPVAAGVDAGALLLGPFGNAVPLSDSDDEGSKDDDTAPTAVAGEGDAGDEQAPEELPVELDEEAAPAVAGEPDDEPSEKAIDDEGREPLELTAPLALEPTAPLDVEEAAPGWATPAPAGGGRRLAPFPAAPPPPERRSTLPLLGLVALVAIAAVIAYMLSSDDDDDTPARLRASATSTTVTFPAFFPSPTVTTAPPAALPATSLPPGIPPVPAGGGLATAPPGAGSATSQIQVLPSGAVCDDDQLSVGGTIVNNGGGRYNVTFSVTVVSPGGQPLGTARTTVSALGPNERRDFQASGTCSGTLGPGDRPQTQIEGVTPA